VTAPDATGPGRYDGWCTRVREAVHARGVVLIIFHGDDGSGFSCQADFIITNRLPEILEETARKIRGAAPPHEEVLRTSIFEAAQTISQLRAQLEIAHAQLAQVVELAQREPP
jgi:hypothetical protein